MDCKNITTACRGSRQAAAGGLSTQIFQGLKQRCKASMGMKRAAWVVTWEWNEWNGRGQTFKPSLFVEVSVHVFSVFFYLVPKSPSLEQEMVNIG